MKKFMTFVGLVFACMATAWAQHSVEIKGKVRTVEGDVKVSVNGLGETTVNPDHTYSLRVEFEKPGCYTVSCEGKKVDVWLDDENLGIDFMGVDTAQVKYAYYIDIKGGKKNEVMNMVNYANYLDYYYMFHITDYLPTDTTAGAAFMRRIYLGFDAFKEEMSKDMIRFVASHYGDRISVMEALRYLDPEKDAALIESTLRKVEECNPGTTLPAEFRERARVKKEREERMKVGRPAPDFSLPDAEGKMHSLAEFKGKVLVIDFWASWCGPCRAEIPHLKEYCEEFMREGKDVAFLSISMDAKEDAWLKAVKEEGMPWLQLRDTKPDGVSMGDLYQFRGIPFILVIDKDGKIYRKGLRGTAVRQAVLDALAGKAPQP